MALSIAVLATGCTPSEPSASPTTPSGPTPAANVPTDLPPPASPDDTEQVTRNPDTARVLNEHLDSFIRQAGFTALGGDHDWMNASASVETASGTTISVFLYPLARAGLGDVSFEQTDTREVKGTTVEVGRRSNGQAAARFDCGDYQFRFFGDDEPAVNEVAVAVAAEVPCPYSPTVPHRP